MNCRVFIAMLLLSVPAAQAFGQGIPQPGIRVRVITAIGHNPIAAGTLVGIVGDTVVIGGAVGPIVLNPERLLQRSLGLHRHAGRGFVNGFVVGAAIGALIAGVTYNDCSQTCLKDKLAMAAAGGVLLGLPSGLFGALLASGGREDWQTVPRAQWRLGSSEARALQVVGGLRVRF